MTVLVLTGVQYDTARNCDNTNCVCECGNEPSGSIKCGYFVD
jgi:hypothetical protein